MKKIYAGKVAWFLVLTLTVILGFAGCGASDKKESTEQTKENSGNTVICIAAAASLQGTFEEKLIPMFEKENPGVKVEGTYASSGDLQQQIEAGLEADLFFSAATSNMDTLVNEGLIAEDTVTALLKNDVVLIVPEGTETKVTGFSDLTKADVVAIGDPESVPAGKYAKEILTNLGIYEEVAAKASFGTSVTAVCAQVAEGSADAGIVYATDALGQNQSGKNQVEVLATAEDSMMDTPVVYPVAVTKNGEEKAEAADFLTFLKSEEALSIFKENGFTVK